MKKKFSLENKVIVITGALGLLGKKHVEVVAENGGIPVIIDLHHKKVLSLAKICNYVPGAGIWLNTQRPEWNDANNALAGFGLSMVTVNAVCLLYPMVQLRQSTTLGSLLSWVVTYSGIPALTKRPKRTVQLKPKRMRCLQQQPRPRMPLRSRRQRWDRRRRPHPL